jgi:hypothetical protein
MFLSIHWWKHEARSRVDHVIESLNSESNLIVDFSFLLVLKNHITLFHYYSIKSILTTNKTETRVILVKEMNRHWLISTHLITDQKTRIIQLRRSRLSKRRILLRNDRSILLNKKNHSTERIERLNSFDLEINQSISLSCYLQFERKTIHRHDSQKTIELFRSKQICFHNQISSSSNLINFLRCQQKF